MANKKIPGRLTVGTRVRVKPDVTVPEMPEVPCQGWSGRVDKLIGKSNQEPKYVVEWDDETIAGLPLGYRERCEENGLYFRMACLSGDQLESLQG